MLKIILLLKLLMHIWQLSSDVVIEVSGKERLKICYSISCLISYEIECGHKVGVVKMCHKQEILKKQTSERKPHLKLAISMLDQNYYIAQKICRNLTCSV